MLKVHRKDQIALVDASMDYGLCAGRSKTGEPCDAVVNKCVRVRMILSATATRLCEQADVQATLLLIVHNPRVIYSAWWPCKLHVCMRKVPVFFTATSLL